MFNNGKVLQGLVAAGFFLPSVNAFWRMQCGVIQTGRVDAIVSPGAVAGHAHKLSGASNVGLTSSYDTLQASQCTSCSIQADKSLYWTPQLYYQKGNGSFQEVSSDGTVVYYLGRGVNRANIEPFPPGFKMISGNPSLRSNDTTTMTFSNATFAGRLQSDRVSFACLDSSGPMPQQNYMFRTKCDQGLRAQINFQSCWNGGAYQSDQSHVAYMSQIDNGVCPPTHPHQLAHLFFEVLYHVNSIDQSDGGKFVFSNGDTTGFGFHGDFFNGWDMSVLTNALSQCVNNDSINGQISLCPPLAASDTPYASTNCPERPAIVNETVHGMLSQLPGCNPVTSGPASAPQQVCATQPNTIDVTQAAPMPMYNPAVGDLKGTWAYNGCVQELKSGRALAAYRTTSNNMTIDSCTSTCKTQGYSLAGLEFGQECYCASALSSNATYMSTSTCSSTPKMICNGNSTQWCGASSLLTVWTDTSYVTPAPLIANSTTTTNGTATYVGCYAEPSSARALPVAGPVDSVNMSNDVCVAYCKSKGYSLAGTENGQECWCGNANGGTNITDITQCSTKCSGTNQQFCGAAFKLSVWKIAGVQGRVVPSSAANGTATYVGCYTDSVSGRTLNGPSTSGSSISVDQCAAFCQTNNYPLFGVEYGQECFCGNSPSTSSTTASEQDCAMTCAGNSSQVCGGASRISVWNNTLYATTHNVANVNNGQYGYLGCYTEGTSGRALGQASTSDAKMTVEMCATFCFTKGYSYIGVEYSGECYCNNAGPSLGSTKANESDCSMKCKGNTQEWCGGPNRLNVYSKASQTSTTSSTSTSTKPSTTTSATSTSSSTTKPTASPSVKRIMRSF